MSLIGQVLNINQTMYVPAHIVAEHLASMKFADEFAKLSAEQKKRKVEAVPDVEKSGEIDENNTKEEERERYKHIDLKG